MTKFNLYITTLFPLWLILSSIFTYSFPSSMSWFTKEYVTAALGGVMLFMGLTLEIDDFKRILYHPKPILLGVFLQYTLMPLSGLLVSEIFNLSSPFAIGILLVASCPGGTASNVFTYIAKADVALSVSMTGLSTILGIVATPFLTKTLVGSRIEVDAIGLLISTVKVIIVPIFIGVFLNKYFHRYTKKVIPFSPVISMILIVLIVSSVIGGNKNSIQDAGLTLIFAIFTLHSFGYLSGYLLSKFINKDEIISRTISIEVGMQNAGLGVVLAKSNFTDPLVAIPPAIASLLQSLIASAMAFRWSR